jgi:hypothetical protein
VDRLAFAVEFSIGAASSALAADFPPYAAPPQVAPAYIILYRHSISAAISVLVGVALVLFPIQLAVRFPAPQAVRSSAAVNSVLITSSTAAS